MLNKKSAFAVAAVLVLGVVVYFGLNRHTQEHAMQPDQQGQPSQQSKDSHAQNGQSGSSKPDFNQSRIAMNEEAARSVAGVAGSAGAGASSDRKIDQQDQEQQKQKEKEQQDADKQKSDSSSQVTGAGQPLAKAPLTEEQKKQLEEQAQKAAIKGAACVLVSYETKNATAKSGPHRYMKNKLKLPEDARTASNFCVRVDGTPVKYQFSNKSKEELVIGMVGKPNSAVTVRYCRNHVVCNENCVIPKDEFMEALAGDDAEEKGAITAHWNPKTNSASQEEVAVDHELEGMEDALTDDRKPGVFSAWLVARQTPACVDKTVAVNATKKLAQADGQLERKTASIPK